ncbi:MAG: hypothetical protein ACRDEA_03260 [Microcystaceae cyanobacterium]
MSPRTLAICHKISLEPGWTLNVLNPRIATITNSKGERKTTYFGFETKQQANAFKQAMISRKLCTDVRVRKAERLSTKWECKIWGVSTEFLILLLNQSPTVKELYCCLAGNRVS